ncbi:hypothetical protein NE865_05266 [Phthorimaea operculella]|nr:hypothetical protein NE865_05266 [Phthorimaea operculella]
MGITCEIGIYKPEVGAFRPGDVVAGVIKYGFDKDTTISEITVSLKGIGRVHVNEKTTTHSGNQRNEQIVNYIFTEEYVDFDYVITNNNQKENLNFQKAKKKFCPKYFHAKKESLILKRLSTTVLFKAIHPRLVEVYTFTFSGKTKNIIQKMHEEKVKGTSSKTGVLRSGKSQVFEFEITVPADNTSIENAIIVSRKYFVVIKVVLPVPHRNAFLKIPVQIGDIIKEDGMIREIFEYNLDAPPTYWEAMTEIQKDDEIDEKDMKANKL